MYFKDRYDAGKHLATALKSYEGQDVLVLALPRGGIPVGFEIAQALNAPLDVLELGVPYHEELAMGALGPNDGIVLNQALIRQLGITEGQINAVLEKESRELNRRLKAFRGERPFPELSQKTVILVDDGLATGATRQTPLGVPARGLITDSMSLER
jgi:putative phosphoribosyl transferase